MAKLEWKWAEEVDHTCFRAGLTSRSAGGLGILEVKRASVASILRLRLANDVYTRAKFSTALHCYLYSNASIHC